MVVIQFILQAGNIMSIGFEKAYALQTDLNLDSAEINFFIAFFSFFNIAAGKSRSSFPNNQPLTEPAIMPASKYFWKKGYMTSSGRLEMIMVAYLSSSAIFARSAVL